MNKKEHPLKHIVFWPPFILLLAAVAYSFIDEEGFAKLMTDVNVAMFANAGWLFEIVGLFLLFACIVVFFSPMGKVRIGGTQAKPMLKRWNWFAITLCTGIAVGILFWGVAAPISFLSAPPQIGIEPMSIDAALFSEAASMWLWGPIPYAIYTVPALLFAFVYYNMKKPFSLGSLMYPIMGERALKTFGKVTDIICVFALICGMGASLGMGILSIAGGLNTIFLIKSNVVLWAIIDIVIVLTFVISSITGVLNGIRILCDLNGKIFLVLPLFILIFGAPAFVLSFSTDSLGYMLQNVFKLALYTGAGSNDQWPLWWTIFCWANWMAWAPITGVFLGRIGYGYTVREFIGVNLLGTSLFSMAWFAVFSGTSIHMQLFDKFDLVGMYNTNGFESLIYALLEKFPLGSVISVIFIFTIYLSYVTGSDAMTSSIGGLCTTGISPESPEPPKYQKIIWGVVLGVISWVMIAMSGVDGIKMLSNLGGFPVLFLEAGWAVALLKVAWNPSKYDCFKEDYDQWGRVICARPIGEEILNEAPATQPQEM